MRNTIRRMPHAVSTIQHPPVSHHCVKLVETNVLYASSRVENLIKLESGDGLCFGLLRIGTGCFGFNTMWVATSCYDYDCSYSHPYEYPYHDHYPHPISSRFPSSFVFQLGTLPGCFKYSANPDMLAGGREGGRETEYAYFDDDEKGKGNERKEEQKELERGEMERREWIGITDSALSRYLGMGVNSELELGMRGSISLQAVFYFRVLFPCGSRIIRSL